MDYNYHTHTFRCHHAGGEEIEYIKNAIKAGIKDFGFADHAPFLFPDDYQSWYRVSMRRICKTSKRLDLPLEINFLGLRQRRNYPNEAFWEVAGQEQCPVTFGTDSHSPDSVFQPDIVRQAAKLVDKYSLHYIGKPKLIMLQK